MQCYPCFSFKGKDCLTAKSNQRNQYNIPPLHNCMKKAHTYTILLKCIPCMAAWSRFPYKSQNQLALADRPESEYSPALYLDERSRFYFRCQQAAKRKKEEDNRRSSGKPKIDRSHSKINNDNFEQQMKVPLFSSAGESPRGRTDLCIWSMDLRSWYM